MRMMILLLLVGIANVCLAGSVTVEFVTLQDRGSGNYRVDTRLRHADTGWEHYADAWRVVNPSSGKVLATRTLFHPHVDEQPFTRSVSVTIPKGVKQVYVEAHDKVHGWNKSHIMIDLTVPQGKGYKILK